MLGGGRRRTSGRRPPRRGLRGRTAGALGRARRAHRRDRDASHSPHRDRRDHHRARRPSRPPSGSRTGGRRSATERLELAAAAGWPAPETDRLGDWLLRAADGWTGRGNSALAVGDPGRPLPAAVDAVIGWYRERRLPPAIAVPLPLGGRVQPELDRRGWDTVTPTLVQTAPLAALGGRRPMFPDVVLHREPTPEWFMGVGGRKGGLPAAARAILTGVPEARYAAGYADGVLVATARGVLTEAGSASPWWAWSRTTAGRAGPSG